MRNMHYVVKGKKRRDGRRSPFRGRFKVTPNGKVRDVPLGTTDRQVAEKRLADIVREEQRESAGLIAPKSQRETASARLETHIQDYVSDRRAIGRDEKYVRELEQKLVKLASECGWQSAAQVTPESFCAWRAKQRKNPKTLNEYLNAINGLMNWLERRIGPNPLRHVQKVQTNGTEKTKRRAFTSDELDRLVSMSGSRGVVYLVAARTGIRRGELAQIEWRDVHLDAPQPFVAVRASVAKNHLHAMQPLTPDAVCALRELHSARATEPNDRLFSAGIPRMEQFRKDLDAAGIRLVDSRGERADFHALRKTFGTMLTLAGIGERTVMELMRHSDMRLTAKIYTDANMLPTSEAMVSLMRFAGRWQGSRVDSHDLVPSSPALSAPAPMTTTDPKFLTAGDQMISPSESASVQQSPQDEEHARCRVRTCDFLRVKQALYH